MIELAITADYNLLHHLDKQIFTTPWSLGSWRHETSSASSLSFIVNINGGHAGFINITKTGDEIELKKIGMLPACRKRGAASQVLKQLHTSFAGQVTQRVILEVACSNIAAIGLYDSLGYSLFAVRENYYNTNEDALCLEKKLVA